MLKYMVVCVQLYPRHSNAVNVTGLANQIILNINALPSIIAHSTHHAPLHTFPFCTGTDFKPGDGMIHSKEDKSLGTEVAVPLEVERKVQIKRLIACVS